MLNKSEDTLFFWFDNQEISQLKEKERLWNLKN